MTPIGKRTDDEIEMERLLVLLDSTAFTINARFSSFHANVSRSSSIPILRISKT